MMSRRTVAAAAAVVVAAGAGAAGLVWRQRQETERQAEAGLWTRRFTRPDGTELDMAGLRGRPLVVNFWATWCAPCVKEMPALDRFHRSVAPRGWQVVGLAIDRRDAVQEFLRRLPVGFPIGLAALDGTELARTLGNPSGALPFTVMFNAAGRVVQRKLGETSYDELMRWADAA